MWIKMMLEGRSIKAVRMGGVSGCLESLGNCYGGVHYEC